MLWVTVVGPVPIVCTADDRDTKKHGRLFRVVEGKVLLRYTIVIGGNRLFGFRA